MQRRISIPLALAVLAGCTSAHPELSTENPYKLKYRGADAELFLHPTQSSEVYEVDLHAAGSATHGTALLPKGTSLLMIALQNGKDGDVVAYNVSLQQSEPLTAAKEIARDSTLGKSLKPHQTFLDTCDRMFGAETHLTEIFDVQVSADKHSDALRVRLQSQTHDVQGLGRLYEDPRTGKALLLDSFTFTRKDYPELAPGVGISVFGVESDGKLSSGSWATASTQGHWNPHS